MPWAVCLALATRLVQLERRARGAGAEHARARGEFQEANLTLTRIRQAIESASDAIGIGDTTGTSLYHNRAHFALFGYTVEELNALPGIGVLFADERVASAMHASIRAGLSWVGEADVCTKDGRHIPCLVRADLIRDETGNPVGIFGVFTDVSERIRARRMLEEQRQELDVTLQSIGDAVIAVDVEGRVRMLNPVAQQLTGWSQDRAAGQPLAEVLHLRDERSRRPCESAITTLLRERRSSHAASVYFLVGPGNSERLVAENAALIRTTGGEVSGAVLALRDITRDRARADEAARAGKLEALGLMAGGIAHDFANLLTAMVGQLTLAQLEPGLPEKTRTRLDELERVVWRARDITQQLTGFARGSPTQKKIVALPPLLREAAGLALSGSSVTLVCEFAPDLWAAEVDEGQIVQVINNLAVNAAQAMPQGGTLTLTAANGQAGVESQTPTPGGRWVNISISDTGCGIPSEHLSKIFEPFFTTKPNGTGLGLATSYSIVKKHGGYFRVETALGRGTTFHVGLPAAADPAGAGRSADGKGGVSAPAARISLGRVLVMDDEQRIREALSLMLSLLNYDVVDADSGEAAIDRFRAARASGRPFDLVLLDLRVPGGMGGVETLRQLRAIDPTVRAVVASGNRDDPAMADCRAAGFSAAVGKPFKMSDVDVVLREALSGPSRPSHSRAPFTAPTA